MLTVAMPIFTGSFPDALRILAAPKAICDAEDIAASTAFALAVRASLCRSMNLGTAVAARTPNRIMTVINSISVKPASLRPGAKAAQLRWHRWWCLWGLAWVEVVLVANFIFTPRLFQFPHEDLAYHFLAFMLPAYWFGMIYRGRQERRYMAYVALLAAPAIEVLQQLTPYHILDPLDILANLSGAMAGFALARSKAGELLCRAERRTC